jgi:hypothetical protein
MDVKFSNIKKTRPARGKTTPYGVALLVEDLLTQAKKILKPWPPITNRRATTAHSATIQLEGANKRRNPRAGEAQQGDFFNPGPENSLPLDIELGA